ncbi:MAG: hypothetical protein ABR921_14305 [Candidatus Sulfotelmatobacter sp.]
MVRLALRSLAALILVFALMGCAVRRGPSRDVLNAAVARGFIDLQPGWRIKAFTPVLKSGGYLPAMVDEGQPGGSVRLSTPADLVGYETSYYSVRRREDKGTKEQGVRVELTSVLLTKDGKATKQQEPALQLFDLPETARFVRLLYLVRVSGADHDMAIVAAATPNALDDLTRAIETSPAERCTIGSAAYCKWVPKGIGVQIESSDH